MGNRDIWDEIELAGHGEHLEEEMFEFLSAYADGECTAKERRLVEAYLAENSAARELLADLRGQSAMVAEGMVDPPEWLRRSILGKTVERRSFRWPFAAGIGVTAAAAASLVWAPWLPEPDATPDRTLLAVQVPDIAMDSLPTRPEPRRAQAPRKSDLEDGAQPRQVAQRAEKPPLYVSVKAQAPGGAGLKIPEPSGLVSAEKVPDPEITYAVAESGGGKFESKQPDVEADTRTDTESIPPKATTPTVLPDAREKLRDKVKKINEEKLEIDGKEKSGS